MRNTSKLSLAVRKIVDLHGGYRERNILTQPHTVEPDPDTWNNDHKVVNVIEQACQEDGYHNGFAVDLVTGLIVG